MKYLTNKKTNLIVKKQIALSFCILIFALNSKGQTYDLSLYDQKCTVFEESYVAEYSDLAYHPTRNLLIMPLDQSTQYIDQFDVNNQVFVGSHNFRTYDLSDQTPGFAVINGNLPNGFRDFEGLVYLYGNRFALTEEKNNRIYIVELSTTITNVNGISKYTFEIIQSHKIYESDPVVAVPTSGDGIEGITYNSAEGDLFVIHETTRRLYRIELATLEGLNDDEDLLVDQHFDLNTDMTDASSLYYNGGQLLVLSHEDDRVFVYDVEYDVQGDATVILDNNNDLFVGEFQPEGIVGIGNRIFITTEGNELAEQDDEDYNAKIINFSANNLDFIKVYLEGAYDTTLGEHTASLFGKKLLPGQSNSQAPAGQPYNINPWNYGGNEGVNFAGSDYQSTDVDWVLVSLRSGLNVNTTFLRMAGILQKDGTIRFTDCFPALSLTGYLVVEHRNHLPIMSEQPITINGGSLTYDFTISDSYRASCTANPNENCTSFGQKEVNQNVWAAYGGNAEQGTGYDDSDDLKGLDKSVWEPLNGMSYQYSDADLNLDGDINGADKIIWFNNNGIHVRINHPLQ